MVLIALQITVPFQKEINTNIYFFYFVLRSLVFSTIIFFCDILFENVIMQIQLRFKDKNVQRVLGIIPQVGWRKFPLKWNRTTLSIPYNLENLANETGNLRPNGHFWKSKFHFLEIKRNIVNKTNFRYTFSSHLSEM